MRLLLSSAGIRTDELANALSDLVGKPAGEINVAVLNEASAVEAGDKSWLIKELADLRRYVGGDMDFVDLLALDLNEVSKRIRSADVLYVIGGNPDYLAHLYQKTGFTTLLKEFLSQNQVYVGSSAGSMVLGRRVSTNEYQKYYGESMTFGTEDYLGVVDFVIKPHFGASDLPEDHEDILRQAGLKEGKKIYAIRDDQAILVKNEEISFVGGEVFVA